MSVERAVELLSPDSEPNYRSIAIYVVHNVDREALACSNDPLKHKLKVRVSALLKSTGQKRAFGCVIARKMLENDWSVVNSHGKSWLLLALHILELPDEVCWLPAIRLITTLFRRIHGKPEFSRDMGGSKVTDFAKKLVLLGDKGFDVAEPITGLLELYPSQCRPSLSAFKSIFKKCILMRPKVSAKGLAAAACAEKASIPVWNQELNEILRDITNKCKGSDPSFIPNGIEEQQWIALFALVENYVRFSPTKIPSSPIVDATLTTLETFSPIACIPAMNFMVSTMGVIPWEHVSLDRTLQSVYECAKMSYEAATSAIEVYTAFMADSLSWIPSKYYKLVSRLVSRGFEIMETYRDPLGVNGLADFVKSPKDFYEDADSNFEKTLTRFFETVILSGCDLPIKLRFKMDQLLLARECLELRTAVLYPEKFSVLPMAVSRGCLKGYESLVHPRFPPLPTAPYDIGTVDAENNVTETADIPKDETAASSLEASGQEAPEVPETEGPQSPQPSVQQENEAKEQELPYVAPFQPSEPISRVEKIEVADIETKKYEPEPKRQKTEELEEADDDNDDDIVIPTINVDDDSE